MQSRTEENKGEYWEEEGWRVNIDLKKVWEFIKRFFSKKE